MSSTPKLDLDDFNVGATGDVAFKKAARVLDGMLHIKIVSSTASSPEDLPFRPNPGEVFLVNSSGSGAWGGHSNDIAIGAETIDPTIPSTYNTAAAWEFVTPAEGFIVWKKWLNGFRGTFKSAWNNPTLIPDFTTESEAATAAKIVVMLNRLRDHGVIPI